MTRAVLAKIQLSHPQQADASSREEAVAALRARLAGSSAKDHVVLDFLADDLREARGALAAVAAWFANVEAALADGDAPQERVLSLVRGGGPAERVDELAVLLEGVRRRLAQVAARM